MKHSSLIILFVAFSISASAVSVRGLQLTDRASKRRVFFKEGSIVRYEYFKPGALVSMINTRYGPVIRGIIGKGSLQILNDSTIRIDEEVIRLENLVWIARTNTGAGIGALALFGGSMALLAVCHHKNDDGTVDTNDTEIGASLGLLVLSGVVLSANSAKPTSLWKPEISQRNYENQGGSY